MPHKTAVLTTVFPGVEKYFTDCLVSLNDQTQKDFIWIIADEGMPNLASLLRDYSNEFHIVKTSGSIIENRKTMISAALEIKAENLIFLDADDICADNRVECIANALESAPIVFNELIIFGQNITDETPIFSPRYQNNQILTFDDVLEKNMFGLTNSAIKSSTVKDLFDLPHNQLIAYDWALFSLALSKRNQAIFSTDTWTKYRQYNMNFAHLSDLSNETLYRALNIKVSHYKFMQNHHQAYIPLYKSYDKLLSQINMSEDFAASYYKMLRNQEHPFLSCWWEDIKILKEINV